MTVTLFVLNLQGRVMGVVEFHDDRRFVLRDMQCRVIAQGPFEQYLNALRRVGLHTIPRYRRLAQTFCSPGGVEF